MVPSKGSNFSITLKTVVELDFIPSRVETTQNVLQEQEEFRIRTKLIFENRFKIKQNINPKEQKDLKYLQKDKSINILPAYKGNVTVIMKRNIYDQKINELLNECNYSKLNKKSTERFEIRIYNTHELFNKILLKYFKSSSQ